MPTITLPANRRDQELILAYLTENASEVLTDKINNGVLFVKDSKQLINRKGLNGFMKYATDEARKLAEKGANSACVEDSVVCGRAMHYFKEDSVEGKLNNQDDTEYTPTPKLLRAFATLVAPVPPHEIGTGPSVSPSFKAFRASATVVASVPPQFMGTGPRV